MKSDSRSFIGILGAGLASLFDRDNKIDNLFENKPIERKQEVPASSRHITFPGSGTLSDFSCHCTDDIWSPYE